MKKSLQSLLVVIIALAPLSIINPIPVSAGVNNCTWTGAGADDNWSTDANWTCSVGTGPATGYDIIFPFIDVGVTTDISNNNLLATNEYAGIWFSGDTTGCSGSATTRLTGNNLILAGDITSTRTGDCFASPSIRNNITFTTNATISSNTIESRILINDYDVGGGVSTLNIGSNSIEFINANVRATINGTGNISVGTSPENNTANFDVINNSTGNLYFTSGQIWIYSAAAFGSGAGTTTVEDTASFQIQPGTCPNPSDVTISENFIFRGNAGISSSNPKIGTYLCNPFFNNSPSDYLTDFSVTGWDITYSGNFTLENDLIIGTNAENTNINGTITGAFNIQLPPFYPAMVGALNITSASNSSLTPNGTYQNSNRTTVLSDSQPSSNVGVYGGHTASITGVRGSVHLLEGGVLMGNGTVGAVDSDGGVLRPGLSPGIMNTGNLDFDAATELDIELEGTTPGAGGHDQYNVTGTVSLGNATLNTILFNGYAPSLNDTFTIINNDGSDAIVGTFGGLAEGTSFAVGSYQFTISYAGGTGNDVVLTTSFEPGPPGTGFGILQNSLFAPIALVLAGLSVVGFANRRRFATKK